MLTCMSSLKYFGYQSLIVYIMYKYLLHFNRLPFQFIDGFLCCAEAFGLAPNVLDKDERLNEGEGWTQGARARMLAGWQLRPESHPDSFPCGSQGWQVPGENCTVVPASSQRLVSEGPGWVTRPPGPPRGEQNVRRRGIFHEGRERPDASGWQPGTGHLHVQWRSLRGSAVPLCECKCVCVCVHISAHVHTCVYICTCMPACVSMPTYSCIPVYMCMYACLNVCVDMHVCMCAHVCMCVHVWISMCGCAGVHACVCVHVCGLGGGRRLTQEGRNSPSLPPCPQPLPFLQSLACVLC